MHKEDKMTPMERLNAFLTGQPMDRILAMPLVCSMSGKACGMTHKTKRSSAENEAKAQIACYERFGNDLMVTEYGLHGMGRALGSKMTDPEDSVPAIIQHILTNLSDVDQLDAASLTKEMDPNFQLHLDATKILIKELGQEVPVGALISGPFTAAASIFKIEDLLRATRKNKEGVHKLMRFATDNLKLIYREFIAEGAMILLCDPIASGTILSRKQYLEFVLPYTEELMEDIHAVGGMVGYHICGDTTSIVEDMVLSGCDMLSIDNCVNLKNTKERVGTKVPLLGNVDPVDVLTLGTVEDVDIAVKNCIMDAYDNPCGYVLVSGCDLNGDVPLENIEQFMKSARQYGKWPVGPQNWN
ncbi:MAG: uroporphyrinogen decarboxylase family protein [Acetivibrio sp.]